MSAGAIAALDLPFIVESIHFFGLVHDIITQQLPIGVTNMNEARTGFGEVSQRIIVASRTEQLRTRK